MKFRAGFISNSSSTSFIIKKNKFLPTIWHIAMLMVPCRGWDEDTDLMRLIAHKIKNQEKKDKIAFKSCNFDTFIRDTGEYYFVSTCNNHPFYLIFYLCDMSYDSTLYYNNYNYSILNYIELDMPEEFNQEDYIDNEN